MKYKRLAVLGILLVSLAGSGVVSHAADGANHVYETDSSYDVSPWIKDDGTVETEFTYEEAPWIADDGTVDMKLARYFRIANAEEGGTDVDWFYDIARKNVQVYKEKDRNSEVVEEFDINDMVYIHLVYEDGWAWSGEVQGYIPLADLSESWISIDKVDASYRVAGDNVKAYLYKDVNSDGVELSGEIFINEMHSDGWAWSEEVQGYIRQEDLSGRALKEKVFNKKSETSRSSSEGSVTIVTDDYEITISPKKN